MKHAVLVLWVLSGVLACSSAPKKIPPPTLAPNVHLSLSNESSARGSVTLAVYVDGELVARRCVSNGGPEGVCSPPLHVPLVVPPGKHTIRVVAVGQIACASTEFVVGSAPLYVHACYEWCPGGRYEARIPERVGIDVQDKPFGFC